MSKDNTYLQRLTRLNDYMARDLAEQKLAEIEERVKAERERRGLQPVTTDTGQVIAWVRTR